MARMELHYFINKNISKLTIREGQLIESYLLHHLYFYLKDNYKIIFNGFGQENFFLNKDEFMFDADFLNFVIQDILLTEEYSLSGIANYTHIPEDVIKDLISGVIKVPSSYVFRKIIQLHSTLRQDLYKNLINKIIES